MAIIFKEEKKQFYLHTNHTSYVMELFEGHLIHSYWGSRVQDIPDMPWFYPFAYGTSTSAHDIPGAHINSTDKLHREYPTYGTGDLRTPALQLENAAGDSITRLRYHSHRILPGKPELVGLPSTYGEDCETLEITLADDFSGVRAVLLYTVFPEKDVLTRSARIENFGNAAFQLDKAASFCVDLHQDGFEIISLHNTNPFVALVSPETTEEHGDAYGFCLMYSGSFIAEISGEQFHSTRVQMGIQPMGFEWSVRPGESFQTPEAILVYSDRGLGEMSRRFHRIIRENVCRGKFRDSERPVLNFILNENKHGHELVNLNVCGKSIVGLHGDKMPAKATIPRLVTMFGKVDYVIRGHVHNSSQDSFGESKLITVSSFSGMDEYAKHLGLNSRPSQKILILSSADNDDCIYDIDLSKVGV